MAKFRKKPVVIEAVQWNGQEIPGYRRTSERRYHDGSDTEFGGDWLLIPTLEGDHYADLGDFIITGVRGEKYPCKAEIFHLTYEPVEEA